MTFTAHLNGKDGPPISITNFNSGTTSQRKILVFPTDLTSSFNGKNDFFDCHAGLKRSGSYVKKEVYLYAHSLLNKHRLINSAVLKYAASLIKSDNGEIPLIVDACAGVEGTLPEARRLGYAWVGVNISREFAKELNKRLRGDMEMAVRSDFTNSPFHDRSVDAVVLAFALTQMVSPSYALLEAERIMKKDGTIIICDTGARKEVTDRILFELAPDVLDDKTHDEIMQFYKNKPFSAKEYCENMLFHSAGMDIAQAEKLVEAIQAETSSSNQIIFKFHSSIMKSYFRRLTMSMDYLGLDIAKAGLLVAAGDRQKDEWIVTDPPFALSTEDWISEFLQVKLFGRWKEKSDVGFLQDINHLTEPSMTYAVVLCLQKKDMHEYSRRALSNGAY